MMATRGPAKPTPRPSRQIGWAESKTAEADFPRRDQDVFRCRQTGRVETKTLCGVIARSLRPRRYGQLEPDARFWSEVRQARIVIEDLPPRPARPGPTCRRLYGLVSGHNLRPAPPICTSANKRAQGVGVTCRLVGHTDVYGRKSPRTAVPVESGPSRARGSYGPCLRKARRAEGRRASPLRPTRLRGFGLTR